MSLGSRVFSSDIELLWTLVERRRLTIVSSLVDVSLGARVSSSEIAELWTRVDSRRLTIVTLIQQIYSVWIGVKLGK